MDLKPAHTNGRFNVTLSLMQKRKHKADKPERLERAILPTGRREVSPIRHDTSCRSQHSIRRSNAATHSQQYIHGEELCMEMHDANTALNHTTHPTDVAMKMIMMIDVLRPALCTW